MMCKLRDCSDGDLQFEGSKLIPRNEKIVEKKKTSSKVDFFGVLDLRCQILSYMNTN